jgi:hypothetical protein
MRRAEGRGGFLPIHYIIYIPNFAGIILHKNDRQLKITIRFASL